MDIRQLRAFVMLAECSSYREAAQRLFITQPALTKQIQTLENELGVTLFVRGRHGAQMTHTARLLLDKTRQLICQAHEYREFALSVARGTKGHLAIGFGISGIKQAPEWVTEFRHHYPDIEISLEDMPSRQQKEGLLNGQLQLAFIRLPVDPPLTGHSLRAESLALAAKKTTQVSARLAEEGNNLLATLPLLLLTPERGTGLDRQVSRFLQFHRVTPNIVQRAGDIQTLMALVEADAGVAIVPQSAVWFAGDDVELISLNGPYSGWDVGLAWNPSLEDPVRDLFIQMIRKQE
ncbi:LysR family transcriptional regulator [Salmonella enterica subsp. salamae]|uniref:LysR family transcriptional regulator n=3 Tax=Salmonella enterica TaxID=28901 RepID=A0A8F7UWD7_SALER|nr:LysR family transcriptional regulator [Salmonella enterica]AFO66310.1 putative transcriptional regulator [Salmonella enterica subsp. salamae serovar Sofia]EBK2701770.1 LysR family transcriptional regulator [Salmonella enterica subsp. enterica serovar Paratyphi B]EDS8305236.1 LysR family transcriptional regulator [Salmonella enterica subsp. enterica serovar Java]EDT7500386.1 LysR family transcriptional regulator [Salmonella enterica subsp. enterica serovar Schleissheim]EDV4531612.1 LysR fami